MQLTKNCLLGTALASLVLAPACGGDDTPAMGSDSGSGNLVDAAAPPSADAGTGGGAIDAQPASDPALPGPWGIHVDDTPTAPLGGDTIELTICSPAEDGQPIATPSPLVIVSPGFQLPRGQYISMCRHLASWGYVAITREFPGSIFNAPSHQKLADDTTTLIDWALISSASARIDATRIGVAGHSLGGKVSILTAIQDDRVDAVVGWDPVDAKPPVDNGSPSVSPERMPDLMVPLAVIGQPDDTSCAPAEDNFSEYYKYACNAEAIEVTVDGADHMDWVDDRGTCGLTCGFCANGATDDGYTQELTRRLTVAFFERHVRSSSALDAYLSEDGIGAGTQYASKTGCP